MNWGPDGCGKTSKQAGFPAIEQALHPIQGASLRAFSHFPFARSDPAGRSCFPSSCVCVWLSTHAGSTARCHGKGYDVTLGKRDDETAGPQSGSWHKGVSTGEEGADEREGGRVAEPGVGVGEAMRRCRAAILPSSKFPSGWQEGEAGHGQEGEAFCMMAHTGLSHGRGGNPEDLPSAPTS